MCCCGIVDADIPLPEAVGRRQLFKLNLEKVDVASDVDYDKLVAATEVPITKLLLEEGFLIC